MSEKDTNQFLLIAQYINVSEVNFMCTLDVKNLFTNLPYTEGCEAIWEKLSIAYVIEQWHPIPDDTAWNNTK